ncbi:hypothetical protein [Krasilnikovia sp. MM14-A1259]|uniref:hypothetical protein n=1 Tax=Krasilnikovia sp. MM14-A1259 TaxID=3373539 RepID=UPI0038303F48
MIGAIVVAAVAGLISLLGGVALGWHLRRADTRCPGCGDPLACVTCADPAAPPALRPAPAGPHDQAPAR